MNIDSHTVQIIILAIINIILLTSLYWKLRSDVDKRPTYQKVEEMIKRDTCNEQRIETIVKRDSFPKSDGKVLLSKMDNVEKVVASMSQKLDTYFKPRKEIP